MVRPEIDTSRHGDALSEGVSRFAKENGLRKDRAWAELVAIGLSHTDEYDEPPQEPQNGEPVKTHNGWETH